MLLKGLGVVMMLPFTVLIRAFGLGYNKMLVYMEQDPELTGSVARLAMLVSTVCFAN